MKKYFLSLAAALMSTAMSFGQDVQMATLQHGDNLSAFYGADAFKSAMEAAEAGDLISLSAGAFNATDITKAVKIQGAGYVQDPANNRHRTTITNDIKIQIPEGQSGLYIEGINVHSDKSIYIPCELRQFTFTKCRVSYMSFSYRTDGKGINGLFSSCRIGTLDLKESESSLIKNCIVGTIRANDDVSPTVVNCIINSRIETNVAGSYSNSYIVYPSSNEKCSYYNCVTLSQNDRYTHYYINTSNESGNVQYSWANEESKNAFFAMFAEDDNSSFINIDQVKGRVASPYAGTDGTEIGIYGGDTPFTDVPSNPQITSKQIATQSDANGKLAVKITVEAQK